MTAAQTPAAGGLAQPQGEGGSTSRVERPAALTPPRAAGNAHSTPTPAASGSGADAAFTGHSATPADEQMTTSCERCGYVVTADTPARAAYGLRRHSCARHLERAATRARGEAKRAAVDRTPKPCLHPRADHRHGTHATYVLDRCRCRPCLDANTAYERMRSRQAAYGRWQPYVDAEPVREHLRALAAAGLGWKRIAKMSGVSNGAMTKLIYGIEGRPPSRKVRRETADAILAVEATLDVLGDTVCVEPGPTRAMLRGLVAAGWSQSKLARAIGTTPANFGRTLHGEQPVQARTARAVRALATSLATAKPPEGNHRDRIAASRARNYAAARRWTVELLWDALDGSDGDVVIEGPFLDNVAIERAMRGEPIKLSRDERVEAVRRLLAAGVAKTHIAVRLRVSGATVDALVRMTHEIADGAA